MSDKSKTSDKSMFDKLVGGGNMILYCLIPGEEASFKVPISSANKNQVSSLAEAIRNHRLDLFKNIDSSRLKLYKNKENADGVIIRNLINDNVAILDGTELMNPENTIHGYFNIQPTPIIQGEKGDQCYRISSYRARRIISIFIHIM